ncbi:MAG: type I methionyl aminopeptidase [bacterium]
MAQMKEQAAQKNLGRNDPCWCGSGKKFKKCHMNGQPTMSRTTMSQTTAPRTTAPRTTAPPTTAHRPSAPVDPWPKKNKGGRETLRKTAEQIEGIRKAGSLASQLLDMLETRIEPGVTTGQINDWVHEATLEAGAVSAPLNYKGFPKSLCTSINEVVCHGIPGEEALKEGDIINVDVTPILHGFYGDSSRMYLIGKVSPEAEKLSRITKECMELGIAQVRPGGTVGDIGHAIQVHAEKHGYSVVREFVGHGTGVYFHEPPQIPHFGRRGHGPPLLPGMVFTIEPMINIGKWKVKILADGWTALTNDGSLSAQWEHTVAVTDEGVDVLTAP